MTAADIEALVKSVARQMDLDRKVEVLLLGLTERLKTTSNDQNVQRLARDLRDAIPRLREAMLAEADA